jgi:hypothetical protein
MQKLMSTFIDNNRQVTRISVNMADVGSLKMPALIDSLQQQAGNYFDTSKTTVTLTGSSITFLEGVVLSSKDLKKVCYGHFFSSLCACFIFLNQFVF